MGTRSCHSNQSSYPTRIKYTTFVEFNILSMYAKFQLIVSERKIFKHFLRKLTLSARRQPRKIFKHFLRKLTLSARRQPRKIFKHFLRKLTLSARRQPIKFTDLDKSRMNRIGLLNKHFCKKNPNTPNETEKKCQFPLFPL